jgi:hypothetical protein
MAAADSSSFPWRCISMARASESRTGAVCAAAEQETDIKQNTGALRRTTALMFPLQKQKGRHARACAGVAASGLPVSLGRLKFDFPARQFRHNGKAVLDFQVLDLAVSHLAAEADERQPPRV